MSDSSIESWLSRVLREYALKLLGARDYSIKNLSDKLKFRSTKIAKKVAIDESIQREVIEGLVEKLKLSKFLDDQRYASNYVNSRSDRKGLRMLQMELIRKGIDKELITEILKDAGGNQKNVAWELLLKKSKYWRETDKYKLKQKALSLLVRNGFDYDTSRELVDKWFKIEYNAVELRENES